VLSARSPVFRAELLSLMKESKLCAIKDVDDMEVHVFEALLHFRYTDSITEVERVMKNSDTAMMAQHLLVAADRYDVERLKIFCESKLNEKMEVHNVATTLQLWLSSTIALSSKKHAFISSLLLKCWQLWCKLMDSSIL
jgi:speckle-type POZ protein